jgi:solute:Na+ symporter, SSS family
VGVTPPLSSEEAKSEFTIFAPVFACVIVCTAWYFGTGLFYRASSPAHEESVENFFRNLATPIDATRDGIVDYDPFLYRLIGALCLVYGAFVLLLMAIPQASVSKRCCFLFIGGVIFGLGTLLFSKSRSSSAPPRTPELKSMVVILTDK